MKGIMNPHAETAPILNDTLHVGTCADCADEITEQLAQELSMHRAALLARFQPRDLYCSDFRVWLAEQRVRFIGCRGNQELLNPAVHAEQLEIAGKAVAEIRIEWFDNPRRYDMATIVY